MNRRMHDTTWYDIVPGTCAYESYYTCKIRETEESRNRGPVCIFHKTCLVPGIKRYLAVPGIHARGITASRSVERLPADQTAGYKHRSNSSALPGGALPTADFPTTQTQGERDNCLVQQTAKQALYSQMCRFSSLSPACSLFVHEDETRGQEKIRGVQRWDTSN